MSGAPPALRLVRILAESYHEGELSDDELVSALDALAPELAKLARGAPSFAIRFAISAAATAVESWADMIRPPASEAPPDER